MDTEYCFHCGLDVKVEDQIVFDEKKFCCNGCKTVYEIFSLNDMTCYYDFEKSPGATPLDIVVLVFGCSKTCNDFKKELALLK